MAQLLTPTTELEAVNILLGTVLEAPVNTLLGTTSADAQRAIAVLSEVSREIQQDGYNFNSEKGYTLAPDAFTGEIPLPLNCLNVDSVQQDAGIDVVARGKRLYDRVKHTYRFDRSITVDMTVLLPFDELPEAVRRYITIRAARVFQKRTLGDGSLDAFTAQDEALAWRSFRRVVGRNSDHNIFNAPDMQQMLRRR